MAPTSYYEDAKILVLVLMDLETKFQLEVKFC